MRPIYKSHEMFVPGKNEAVKQKWLADNLPNDFFYNPYFL